MNVKQVRSQVKVTEVAVARVAYQKWSHEGIKCHQIQDHYT